MSNLFSERNGFNSPPDRILVREDAPEQLRQYLINTVITEMALSPSFLRDVICDTLLIRPDKSNWSEYPNIYNEAEDLIFSIDWYYIYDIIEAIGKRLVHQNKLKDYTKIINAGFEKLGIGWILQDGIVQARGNEIFQANTQDSLRALKESSYTRAHSELKEAIADLSKRPKPDLTGTVQHSIGALESVARDVCGNPILTLGDVLRTYPNLIPKPVNIAVEKLWGYSSEVARHIREDRDISREEAQLVLGISAIVISYLLDKSQSTQQEAGTKSDDLPF